VPKFDVLVTFEVMTCVTVDAEDEIDAGHKVIANVQFDWINQAANDPHSAINSMELEISKEGADLADQVVRMAKDQVKEMQDALFLAIHERKENAAGQ
jgi:hypothetical protein